MIYKPVWYFIMYIFSVLNAYFIIPFLIHHGLNHRSKVEQMLFDRTVFTYTSKHDAQRAFRANPLAFAEGCIIMGTRSI